MNHHAIVKTFRNAHRLGSKPHHHFFGYYNKTVWNKNGDLVLANQVQNMDENLTPDLIAEVGFFNLNDRSIFKVIDQTTAWNWQMGCQLQWLDGAKGKQVIYNTRTTIQDSVYTGLNSTVYDIDNNTKRFLPLPIYSVSPDSQYALCVSYSRLYITHQTIGYVENSPPQSLEKAPADDGIWCMAIETGEHSLAVSYSQLKRFYFVPSMENAIHWVSHIEINSNSTRCLFLHRWTERVEDETCFLHRLITMNLDGTDMRLLEDSDHPLPQLENGFDPSSIGTYDYEKSEYQISHPLWCSNNQIIVWGPHEGKIHYHLYKDELPSKAQIIGDDVLTENGHMSYSPVSSRWMVSDTYPDSTTNERILFLFDTETNTRFDLGSFYADPKLKKENRCDLHPRWNREGTMVCIDSVHASERQMYLLDVSDITCSV